MSYLDSGRFDAIAIREENEARAEANRLNALALLTEERKFWRAKLERALPHEAKVMREELDKLNEMESQHGFAG